MSIKAKRKGENDLSEVLSETNRDIRSEPFNPTDQKGK